MFQLIIIHTPLTMNTVSSLVLFFLVAAPYAYGHTSKELLIIPQPRYLEGVVNKTFNKVLDDHVKPRDPLYLKTVKTGLLGNKVVAENVTIEGFSDAYLSQIKLSGFLVPRLQATLLIPRVTSYVDNLEVELDDGSIGRGSASIVLTNLKIFITAKIKITSLTATDVKVRPNLEDAEVVVTGNDDEETLKEITTILENFLLNTVNNDVALHERLSKIVQDIINRQ